ncbi:geranylgeranyl pyrophosphate synthetase [Xylariaceae sp. FL1019]|nr:geranylgeranyl pyrophosphate synthetase [Xylariaceae sp. FL1019]
MGQPVPILPDPALGPLVKSISSDELLSGSDAGSQTVGIKDPKVIASYNWIAASSPSILIPGEPPAWTPLQKPPKLNEDSGTYYRDLNAAQFPDHPLQPTIEAVMKMCPVKHSETPSVRPDLVACGSTLGNLLRFARGDVKPFRMLVEVVGTTVHLIRREKSPRETIPDIRGYGHTFPETYTTWGSSVRGSLSHQRIMRYRLGDLDCVVRFECDGYLPGTNFIPQSGNQQDRVSTTGRRGDGSIGNVSSIVGDLASSLVIKSVEPGSKSGSALAISTAGHFGADLPTFELKTRSFKRRDKHEELLAEEIPRLWLKQVSRFIAGYHTYGRFEDIVIANVQSDILTWETKHTEELKRFASLLDLVIQFARDRNDSRLELVHAEGSSTIDIRLQTPDVSPMLSHDASRRWTKWLTGDDEDNRACEHVVGDHGNQANHVDSVSSLDYTACDDECGYCGQCAT